MDGAQEPHGDLVGTDNPGPTLAKSRHKVAHETKCMRCQSRHCKSQMHAPYHDAAAYSLRGKMFLRYVDSFPHAIPLPFHNS
jgi:hypothetical protein